MSEQIKLSGTAAQALWDAWRRDVRTRQGVVLEQRPIGDYGPYTLATDEPLTTPQAIAVCGVSKLVEVGRGGHARLRLNGPLWEMLEPSGRWVPAYYHPANSGHDTWRLVAGDVREEEAPGPRVHDLKTWRDPFSELWAGSKTFEFRRDDRGYSVGDDLVLREWVPGSEYTGRSLRRRVTSIVRGPDYGVPHGYCVMSLRPDAPRPHTLTLPHRTDSLAEAGRHAEGGGVVEDSDSRFCRLRNGEWQGLCGTRWVPIGRLRDFEGLTLGTYVLHPADYRDDAAPEPEPVKPRRGADLRRWAIDHAPRVVLVDRPHGTWRVRWCVDAARFEHQVNGEWRVYMVHDDDEGVPESGTWESES